jgi:hypothetical protein
LWLTEPRPTERFPPPDFVGRVGFLAVSYSSCWLPFSSFVERW